MIGCYWKAAVAGCFALALAGCETTSTTAVWKDPGYSSGAMKSIMVIGVSGDQAKRRLYEDAMVKALSGKGVSAQASYNDLPDSEKISQDSVKAVVEGKGFDGVLVTHVLGVDKETVYHPPMQRYGRPYYRNYYSYYSRVYDYSTSPGYYSTYSSARVETNVYTVANGTLVWTMQSKTLDPENVGEAIDSVVKAITDKMKSDRVI